MILQNHSPCSCYVLGLRRKWSDKTWQCLIMHISVYCVFEITGFPLFSRKNALTFPWPHWKQICESMRKGQNVRISSQYTRVEGLEFSISDRCPIREHTEIHCYLSFFVLHFIELTGGQMLLNLIYCACDFSLTWRDMPKFPDFSLTWNFEFSPWLFQTSENPVNTWS